MRLEASLQVTLGLQSAQGPSHLSPCSLNNITVATCIHTCTCKLTCECVHTNTHAYVCPYVHTHTCAHTHTHIIRPTVKVAESPRHISSPHQPLPHATLDHIQWECLPRWSAVSESPFDLGKCCFEAVPFTVESYLSFRACKLTALNARASKRGEITAVFPSGPQTSFQIRVFHCFPQAEHRASLSISSTCGILERVYTEHNTRLKPTYEGWGA